MPRVYPAPREVNRKRNLARLTPLLCMYTDPLSLPRWVSRHVAPLFCVFFEGDRLEVSFKVTAQQTGTADIFVFRNATSGPHTDGVRRAQLSFSNSFPDATYRPVGSANRQHVTATLRRTVSASPQQHFSADIPSRINTQNHHSKLPLHSAFTCREKTLNTVLEVLMLESDVSFNQKPTKCTRCLLGGYGQINDKLKPMTKE